MNEISYIFLCLHLVTWILLVLTMVELNSLKKEFRQAIDYETTIRKKRKEIRTKK